MSPNVKVLEALTEDQEQTKFATWLTKQGIKFYAIPNGGRRDRLEAFKFKRTGVQSGVPDICIPIPSGPYHGAYIELKRKVGGNVSSNQRDWIEYLEDMGYFSKIARGFEEARDLVLEYLSFTPHVA